MAKSPARDVIPSGTLDVLILTTLNRSVELHGFEIAEAIEARSEDVLTVEEGSLYPALQRLLVSGWITDTWGHTSENRRARYYRLTSAGRKHLEREVDRYQRVARAIARVLSPA
jgi:PadR family transcriptional regulator, regulatory protein PadR